MENNTLEKRIYSTLYYFSLLKRALRIYEIWRYLLKIKIIEEPYQPKISLSAVREKIENSSFLKERIFCHNDICAIKGKKELIEKRKEQDDILKLKYKKLKKFLKLLKFLPFLKGAFIFGSIAIGNVKENSDFDILLISKENRIWSLRAFSFLLFEIFFIRRRGTYHNPKKSKNKICLSHFLTEKSLEYDQQNYYQSVYFASLVPVFGDNKLFSDFFKKNNWLNKFLVNNPQDFIFEEKKIKPINKKSFFAVFIEKIFSGWLGDVLEGIFEKIQIKRIKKSLKMVNTPHRVRVSKKELEFHPDISKELNILSDFNKFLKKL